MSKIYLDSLDSQTTQNSHFKTHKKDPLNDSAIPGAPDPFMLAIMSIMMSISITQQTGQIQSKIIESNAGAQSSLINQESKFGIIVMTQNMIYNISIQNNKHQKQEVAGDGSAVLVTYFTHKTVKNPIKGALASFQSKNQESESIRDQINNQVLLLRQNAQVSETQLNSSINQSQTSMQEDIEIFTIITALTNQITRRS